jgi:uncharacterized protein
MLDFAADLRLFLAPRHRAGAVRVGCDGVSSLGHLVESLGVPLPEVGSLVADGRLVSPGYRPCAGDVVRVEAVARPQPLPTSGFALDVNLGALARRMRLVGLDTSYSNDIDDDALIELATAERRVLLTKDRGLLRRRKLWLGGYVRGDRPDEQLADVIGRFRPGLRPWTRCVGCNGALTPVAKQAVEQRLEPGTRRSYAEFSCCAGCGQLYWRGAHSQRLAAIVAAAMARS